MALDEVLLESVIQLARPVFRVYAWSEPAATFGYFQRYSEVERMTRLRPLVRRPTGGGVVPHDRDWTYSLVFPPTHYWYSLSAVESYCRLHTWISDGFALLGLRVELSTAVARQRPRECFARVERSDLLMGGRKVAGAAQRRAKHGLLIQGSIQPVPQQINRIELVEAFCRAAQARHAVDWEAWSAPESLREHALHLAAAKYSRADYNQRR
jgi:lipoate-protein ligase A